MKIEGRKGRVVDVLFLPETESLAGTWGTAINRKPLICDRRLHTKDHKGAGLLYLYHRKNYCRTLLQYCSVETMVTIMFLAAYPNNLEIGHLQPYPPAGTESSSQCPSDLGAPLIDWVYCLSGGAEATQEVAGKITGSFLMQVVTDVAFGGTF